MASIKLALEEKDISCVFLSSPTFIMSGCPKVGKRRRRNQVEV